MFLTTTNGVDAFDADGNTRCSGSPKVCLPIWTTSIADTGTAVAVSGNIAYAVYDSPVNGYGVIAFDAPGQATAAAPPRYVIRSGTTQPPTPHLAGMAPIWAIRS